MRSHGQGCYKHSNAWLFLELRIIIHLTCSFPANMCTWLHLDRDLCTVHVVLETSKSYSGGHKSESVEVVDCEAFIPTIVLQYDWSPSHFPAQTLCEA